MFVYGALWCFSMELPKLHCVCVWSSLVFFYKAPVCLCMELSCVCVWSSLVFVNGTFLCLFIKLPYICM